VTLATVSDAGPLIHLAEIGSLGLFSTFDTLLVPETVYKEVEAGGVPDELADLSYELVEADESQVGTEELDAGERAAIAVAGERGIVLLTDDLAAREAASDAGVEVHGSIGVVALGYARGGTRSRRGGVTHASTPASNKSLRDRGNRRARHPDAGRTVTG
jgi:predicted nucleic acid-binding protein